MTNIPHTYVSLIETECLCILHSIYIYTEESPLLSLFLLIAQGMCWESSSIKTRRVYIYINAPKQLWFMLKIDTMSSNFISSGSHPVFTYQITYMLTQI